MKIYCLDNTEGFKKEAYDRGYREDVFVFAEEKYYKICLYDKCRLIQDFDSEIDRVGYYVPDPNTLIVPYLTDENIIRTIKEAFNEGLFDYLSPCINLNEEEIQYIFSKEACETYEKVGFPYKISKSELIEMFTD